PCLPKILNSTSIIACERKIVGLLASNTTHEALKDVLRHVNHSLIAVLCFAEVNDPSKQVKLPNTERKQFIFTPAIRVGSFKHARKPDAFDCTFAGKPKVLFVLK